MKEIILDTDDGAAVPVTVSLFESSKGNLYTLEEAARYDSCTHRACAKCGKPEIKTYTLCDDCREKKAIEKYLAMPTKLYDSELIYSERDDKYFSGTDELADYCDEIEIGTDNESLLSLRLVFCKPHYANEVDPNDYYQDHLPEDEGIPSKELQNAFDALNKKIRELNVILSWSPSNVAVRFE